MKSLQNLGANRMRYLVLMAFLSLTLSVRAQTISGTISGSVVDESGAIIPDAQITVTNELTQESRKDTTNAQGQFVFPALQPGSYTVEVVKSGFDSVRRAGLQLQTNQRLSLGNVALTIGHTSQSLTITSEAPPVTTESADVAPELSQAQLQNVPVIGRDVMALLRVLPGIGTIPTGPGGEIKQNDPTGSGASNGGQYGSFTPNVGGFRLFWNTVMVDGQVGSNPDFPGLFMSAMSMDAVSEARILSQNYLADYGRNPGPTIILVSKSGTSAFHGSLYYMSATKTSTQTISSTTGMACRRRYIGSTRRAVRSAVPFTFRRSSILRRTSCSSFMRKRIGKLNCRKVSNNSLCRQH